MYGSVISFEQFFIIRNMLSTCKQEVHVDRANHQVYWFCMERNRMNTAIKRDLYKGLCIAVGDEIYISR